MPIYTYDKNSDEYFEYVYLHPALEKQMRDSGRWFIEDPEIVEQIEQYNPASYRRYLKIKDKTVTLSVAHMRQDLIKRFKDQRSEVMAKLDAEYFKTHEQILLDPENSVKSGASDRLKNIVELKQAWRDIQDHPDFQEVNNWDDFIRAHYYTRKKLDPWFMPDDDDNDPPVTLDPDK
jgi:hypothetical protein